MPLQRLARLIRTLFTRRRIHDELDDEIRFHLAMEVDKLRRLGLGEDEARRRAHVAFGAQERVREECRDTWGTRHVDDLMRDTRLGFRSLARQPLFTGMVLVILGLSVGAASAMFGTVEGILLTPLPVPDAGRVMAVMQNDLAHSALEEVSPANFLDWRERSQSFEPLAAMEPVGLDWQSPNGPIYLSTGLVSEGFFDVFGAIPLHGRTFFEEEHTAGQAAVVVIGHQLWQERFAGDPAIVGQTLILDAQPFRVVGIMAEGFAFPSDNMLWAPKVWTGWERRARSGGFYAVFGRLAPGISRERAQAEMTAIAGQLATEHPATNARTDIALVPLREQMVGKIRKSLLLLLGAVALVLAIAAANIASLQLARTTSRRMEFQVRGALGAGRGRLVRQLFAENFLLGLGGAALGVGVAVLLMEGLRILAPADLPRLEKLQINGQVMLLAAAVSLVVALVTGLAPLFFTKLRSSLVPTEARATGGRLVSRSQGGLIVAQAGISLVLLVAACLLLRSFLSVMGEDRGFRTEGVVVLAVQSWNLKPEPHEKVAFVERTVERLSALPGVRAVGMTSSVPLMESFGADHRPLVVQGQPPPSGVEAPETHFSIVTPGVFEALGIGLRSGRRFDTRDHADAPAVAMVNEALARRYWPQENAIGQRITLQFWGSAPVTREVVGVVSNVRHFALHQSAVPGVFLPHMQAPTGTNAFVIWGEGKPADLLESGRKAIWEANPTMAIYSERTMAELVGAEVLDRRFLLALLGAFALTALILTAAGIFAMMSYVAGQRTREIGVRMAFGARRVDVVTMILRFSARVATIGIGLGLLGAIAATRTLAGALHEVAPLDPIAFSAGALLLLVTALVASWLPAQRAASMDPMAALRAE
ncbi:MAG: ABC transporter permease [Acidobacteriota bacterium]